VRVHSTAMFGVQDRQRDLNCRVDLSVDLVPRCLGSSLHGSVAADRVERNAR
jgi:hypothetical protein